MNRYLIIATVLAASTSVPAFADRGSSVPPPKLPVPTSLSDNCYEGAYQTFLSCVNIGKSSDSTCNTAYQNAVAECQQQFPGTNPKYAPNTLVGYYVAD